MKTIGILKEQSGDRRVTVVPTTVKMIIRQLEYNVLVEETAGTNAGVSDEEYITNGAVIKSREEVINEADTLLCIHHVDLQDLKTDKTIISILNPLFHFPKLDVYFNKPIRLFSLDLMPRTTIAQSMDVLSSMASLAGYKAVVKAADHQTVVIPMFTTAAGTIKPARVLIIGAGVAGLQAIATAKRLGAVVDVFDVRKAAGEEVKSLGASFIEVEGAIDNSNAGGYAVEQSEEYLNKQKDLIDKFVSNASIVISTANIPGRIAPRLIEGSSVLKMAPGSVIVDLAAEQGGNCEFTENNAIIDVNGVKIIGNSHLASELPETASKLLSTNYFNFLKHLKHVDQNGIHNDTIVQDCLVIEEGKIVNERVKSFMF